MRTEASRKRIYIWNAAGSGVYAASSFLMLVVVVRFCGDTQAGIFSMGYAIAQLMLTVGVFEATTFFATDAANRFSHEQYFAFKLCTCAAMIVASIIYIGSFGFDVSRAAIAYALCAFRLVEALSQFWYGAFQKHERLDLGGFSAVWRMVIALALFTLVIAVTRDMVLACVAATLGEAAWLACYDVRRLRPIVRLGKPDFSLKPLTRLLWACLPLFLATFMAAYLNNVAKYAINDVGTDAMQAIFNVLFMPAFVVNLFMIFVMRPSLTTLARYWLEQKRSPFLRIVGKLLVIAVGITAGVLVFAALLGIPVLQLLYGLELTNLMPALLVVMLGGGFLSLSNVFYNAIVVIRAQHFVLIGYGIAIAVAVLVAHPLVSSLGVMGACLTYCIASAGQSVAFAGIFLFAFALKK